MTEVIQAGGQKTNKIQIIKIKTQTVKPHKYNYSLGFEI